MTQRQAIFEAKPSISTAELPLGTMATETLPLVYLSAIRLNVETCCNIQCPTRNIQSPRKEKRILCGQVLPFAAFLRIPHGGFHGVALWREIYF
jgi:hypothetical protein